MIKADDLKRQILFEDIEKAKLEELAPFIKKITLKKKDILFHDGDDTKGIYMIRSGKIGISKATADEWKQTLAVLTEGQFFGELSVMEKRHHEADADAIDKTELFLLSKDAFEKIEKENTDLALQITKKIAIVLSKNLRQMNQKFLNVLINY
jgi:CRP/FNR family transcriptional regulator